MVSTRSTLENIASHVDESMGVREFNRVVRLSPAPSLKDAGRMPLRTFGQVEVDRIIPDSRQPRSEFDKEEIDRLADSIRAHGQLHPIRVRWDELQQKWAIISGERRWRATIAAGQATINCFFHDENVTASEVLEQQLVENLLRRDLKPMEEARAYSRLMELNGWTGKRVAEALRVSTSRVSRALALLDLPADVQKKIEGGTLPKTSAYEISKVRNGSAQRELAQEATNGNLSHAKAVSAVRQRRGKRGASRGVSQCFVSENGLKVTVTAKQKCTYHEVEYALAEAIDEVRHRIDNNIQIY